MPEDFFFTGAVWLRRGPGRAGMDCALGAGEDAVGPRLAVGMAELVDPDAAGRWICEMSATI